jgi:hypothetical protein
MTTKDDGGLLPPVDEIEALLAKATPEWRLNHKIDCSAADAAAGAMREAARAHAGRKRAPDVGAPFSLRVVGLDLPSALVLGPEPSDQEVFLRRPVIEFLLVEGGDFCVVMVEDDRPVLAEVAADRKDFRGGGHLGSPFL